MTSRLSLAKHLLKRRTQLDENRDADSMNGSVDEYRNRVTQLLPNFMKKDADAQVDPLADIDFDAPKVKLSL